MSRTPMLRTLHRIAARTARQTPEQAGLSRRALLRTSAASVAALGLTGAGLSAGTPARAAGTTDIVVIGAGLAGLTAAYELRKAGYRATVIEAADRIGGRCYTDRTTPDTRRSSGSSTSSACGPRT